MTQVKFEVRIKQKYVFILTKLILVINYKNVLIAIKYENII